ncbi:MAG: hypothetical protein WCO71_05360, partial [Pseudomonadota bacterium]
NPIGTRRKPKGRVCQRATQDGKIIKKVAIEKGLVTLRGAAFKKVLAGLTSLEEALQNTQADDFTALDV